MLSITAVGNLASDPVQKETTTGTKVTNEKRDGSPGASIQVRVNDFTLPVKSRDTEAIPA